MKQTSIFQSRGKIAVILVSSLMVIIAVIGLLWAHILNKDPVVHVPTPVMPVPNAFDEYVAAANSIRDGDKIGIAVGQKPGDAETVGNGHRYSLAEKAAMVAENGPALTRLRGGFVHSFLNPPIRSFEQVFPYYAKERGLARLLYLQAQVKQAQGDWGGAADSSLDAVRLGEDVPRGGVMISALVGIACQSIGRRPLWGNAGHLSASQARAVARRLEAIQARRTPFADTMQEEEWGTQASLMELFHKGHWWNGFTEMTAADTEETARAMRWRLMLTSKRTVMSNYTQYMNALVADARRPYASAHALPPMPTDWVNQTLLPAFRQARLKDVDNQTQNALLMITLALQAYKLEHGIYPTSLASLTPGYLRAIPDDLFALSGPLHYRTVGKSYVLYSVGPDGKDDGGKPIFDASQAPEGNSKSNPRYWTRPDSKGDIVAGINIY